MKLKRMALACSVVLGTGGLVFASSAFAQSTQEQIDSLQRQLDSLKSQVNQGGAQPQPAAARPATTIQGHEFLERKPGDSFSLYTRGGELTIYGNLDVSVNTATNGLGGVDIPPGVSGPVGNTGWMPSISSNISYVGVRGFQSIGDMTTHFVYQLETQIDVSNTPGTAETNANQSNQVKGALVSRNSFIGFAGDNWGAMKIGKTDAPYKNSTQRMNPFSGMWGDYQVIMGNTGGDNRVEFGTRLSHSIWYESPNMSGFTFNFLFSPGQNRADDSSNIPAGEPDCAGGNVPGSGGLPVACNDGSYGNVYSTNVAYETGPLYLTAAYEMHRNVNRTSDLPTFNPGDIANEYAYKAGVQYKFKTGTTVGAIYEALYRSVDQSLMDQNERQRKGYWLVVSQQLTAKDSLHAGWAHAGRTPGDPGQHNADPTQADANGFFPNVDNRANMYTFAWKHQIDKNLSLYANYATTINARFAHYDLGAGGRSVTTDCHDASNPDTSGFDPNGGAPHCFTGARLQGVALGMKYVF
jgi:predicted porin